MPEIRLVPCLSDNYAVILKEGDTVVLIDAPEAAPIKAQLKKDGWKLTHILVTHKHDDHIQGIPELYAEYAPEVIGPEAEKDRIPHISKTVREGDIVEVGPLRGQVIATPGHTAGHIAYYFPQEKLLFAGDTLFALGCGRLFEGSPADMWGSMKKLRALPDDTQVYCGHEYTLGNARFALSVDKGNEMLKSCAAEIEEKRAAGRPTIPFKLGTDKLINPFMRADDPAVAAGVGKSENDPVAVFGEVRERKNNF